MQTYEFTKTIGERANATRQIYSDWARSHGVNYNTMAVLYTAFLNEKCSQKYVCEQWSIPKQTVNTTCRDLIVSGMVDQEQSEDDRREKHIVLSEKGREFAKPLVSELLDIEGRILKSMGLQNAERLFELFVAYTKAVEKEFSR